MGRPTLVVVLGTGGCGKYEGELIKTFSILQTKFQDRVSQPCHVVLMERGLVIEDLHISPVF